MDGFEGIQDFGAAVADSDCTGTVSAAPPEGATMKPLPFFAAVLSALITASLFQGVASLARPKRRPHRIK